MLPPTLLPLPSPSMWLMPKHSVPRTVHTTMCQAHCAYQMRWTFNIRNESKSFHNGPTIFTNNLHYRCVLKRGIVCKSIVPIVYWLTECRLVLLWFSHNSQNNWSEIIAWQYLHFVKAKRSMSVRIKSTHNHIFGTKPFYNMKWYDALRNGLFWVAMVKRENRCQRYVHRKQYSNKQQWQY